MAQSDRTKQISRSGAFPAKNGETAYPACFNTLTAVSTIIVDTFFLLDLLVDSVC